MTRDVPAVPLLVLGPPDLLITAVVAALRGCGFDPERVPDPRSARQELAARVPGLLLADLDVPGAAAVAAEAAGEGWRVVVLGGETDRVAAVVAAGGAGRVPKSAALDRLAAVLRDAVAGRPLMGPEEHAEWLARHRGFGEAAAVRARRFGQLSRREREVLHHLAEGRRPAQVAELLYLSVATVRTHVRSIFGKLGVNSLEDAVSAYREFLRHQA